MLSCILVVLVYIDISVNVIKFAYCVVALRKMVDAPV